MIDLMLLEELHSSARFRRWFVAQLDSFPEDAEFVEAWHSVRWTEGESDLEAEFAGPISGTTMIYVEDKIDAPLQRDQIERYRLRSDRDVQEGRCDAGYVVLVAPERYIGGLSPETRSVLDGTISLEKLHAYFIEESDLGERASFKARVLALAIEKRPRIGAGERRQWTEDEVVQQATDTLGERVVDWIKPAVAIREAGGRVVTGNGAKNPSLMICAPGMQKPFASLFADGTLWLRLDKLPAGTRGSIEASLSDLGLREIAPGTTGCQYTHTEWLPKAVEIGSLFASLGSVTGPAGTS